MGGHVPLAVIVITPQFMELHSVGKIRIVAVTTTKRLRVARDIPAASEHVPGLVAQNFAGLFAPKGAPKVVIDRIATAVSAAMAKNDLRELYAKSGFDSELENSPAVLHAFLAKEVALWGPIIKASGFRME
jgi:tripartite-type tricarboxylate transporter receptor subunit TctC